MELFGNIALFSLFFFPVGYLITHFLNIKAALFFFIIFEIVFIIASLFAQMFWNMDVFPQPTLFEKLAVAFTNSLVYLLLPFSCGVFLGKHFKKQV